MTKKLIALLLTGCMVLSMAACGGNNSTPSETKAQGTQVTESAAKGETAQETSSKDGDSTIGFANPYVDTLNTVKSEDTLRIALGNEPSQLLTLTGLTENNIATIDGYLLDTLVRTDEKTGEVVPNVATEWEWIDDKHVWFKLRDDVTMVDGQKLTAEDVLYTIQFAVENAGNQDVGKYYDLEECSVVDEHTVIIGIKQKCPAFIQLLAQTSFGIISKTAAEAAGGVDGLKKAPVIGSGKYIFKEWVSGQYIELERNENYWNTDYVGYYKTIRFVFINDNAARIMAVESGDVDVAVDIPVAMAYPQTVNEKLSVNFFDTERVSNIYMNTASGVFSDKAVREAVYWAIDRASINQVATMGLGVLSDPFVPTSNPYYTDVYEEDQKVDVERAKQILADAGYTGTIKAVALVQQAHQPIMTVIQENLRVIGIELEIASTDSGSYIARAKEGDYDLLYGQLDVDYRLPVLFNPLYGPTIEKGVIGGPKYISEELDAAIETARSTRDEAEAKESIAKVLTITKEEVLAIGINTQVSSVVTSSSVEGVALWPKKFIDCTQVRPVQ